MAGTINLPTLVQRVRVDTSGMGVAERSITSFGNTFDEQGARVDASTSRAEGSITDLADAVGDLTDNSDDLAAASARGVRATQDSRAAHVANTSAIRDSGDALGDFVRDIQRFASTEVPDIDVRVNLDATSLDRADDTVEELIDSTSGLGEANRDLTVSFDRTTAATRRSSDATEEHAGVTAASASALAGLIGELDNLSRVELQLRVAQEDSSEAQANLTRIREDAAASAGDLARAQLRAVDAEMKVTRLRAAQTVTLNQQAVAVTRAGDGWERFGRKLTTTFNPLDRFRTLIGAIKFPVILGGVGLLGEGLVQLAAGAGAVVSQFTPAVGVLGAIPGLFAAIATGAGSIVGVTNGTLEAASAVREFGVESEEAKELLDKMPDSARPFVLALASIGDEFKNIQTAGRDAAFPNLTTALERLGPLLPTIERGFVGAATAMSGAFAEAANLGSAPLFTAQFSKFIDNNTRLIETLGTAIRPLVAGFLNVAVAAGPMTQRIAEAAVRGAEMFEVFTRDGDRMTAFFDRAADVAGSLLRSVVDLGVGIFNMFRIANQAIGIDFVGGLESAADRFRAFTESGRGILLIAQYFQNLAPLIQQVGGLIYDLSSFLLGLGARNDLAPLIAQFRDQLLPAIESLISGNAAKVGPLLLAAADAAVQFFTILSNSPLVEVVTGMLGLAAAVGKLILTYPGLSNVVAVVIALGGAFKALQLVSKFTGITGLVTVLEAIGPAGASGARGLAGVIQGFRLADGPAKTLANTIGKTLAGALGKIGSLAISAGTKIGGGLYLALGPIGLVIGAIALVAGGAYLIYKNWDGIVAFFKRLWENVVGFFTGAFDKIKGIFGFGGEDAGQSFDEGLSGGLEGVEGTVGALPQRVESAYGTVNFMQPLGQDTGSAFGTGLESGFDPALGLVSDLPPDLLGAYGNTDFMAGLGSDTMGGFNSGLEAGVPAVGGTMEALPLYMQQYFVDTDFLKPKGEAVINGLRDGLVGGVPLAESAVAQVPQDLIDAYGDADFMRAIGATTIKGLEDGLIKGIPVAEFRVSEIPDGLKEAYGDPDFMRFAGEQTTAGLAAGIRDSLPSAFDGLPNAYATGVAPFINGVPRSLYAPGQQAAGGFREGFDTELREVYESAGLIEPGIKANLGDPATWLNRAGFEAGDGLTTGLDEAFKIQVPLIAQKAGGLIPNTLTEALRGGMIDNYVEVRHTAEEWASYITTGVFNEGQNTAAAAAEIPINAAAALSSSPADFTGAASGWGDDITAGFGEGTRQVLVDAAGIPLAVAEAMPAPGGTFSDEGKAWISELTDALNTGEGDLAEIAASLPGGVLEGMPASELTFGAKGTEWINALNHAIITGQGDVNEILANMPVAGIEAMPDAATTFGPVGAGWTSAIGAGASSPGALAGLGGDFAALNPYAAAQLEDTTPFSGAGGALTAAVGSGMEGALAEVDAAMVLIAGRILQGLNGAAFTQVPMGMATINAAIGSGFDTIGTGTAQNLAGIGTAILVGLTIAATTAVPIGMLAINAAFTAGWAGVAATTAASFALVRASVTAGVVTIAGTVTAGMGQVSAAFAVGWVGAAAVTLASMGAIRGAAAAGMAGTVAAVTAGMGAVRATTIAGMAGMVAAFTVGMTGSRTVTVASMTLIAATTITAMTLLRVTVTANLAASLGVTIAVMTAMVGVVYSSMANLVNTVRSAMGAFVSAIAGQAGAVYGATASLGYAAVAAISWLAARMYYGGVSAGSSLAAGLRSRTSEVAAAANALANAAAAPMPGSPAKVGPLSGRGYVLLRGQRFGDDLATGLRSRVGSVASASDAIARSLSDAATFPDLGAAPRAARSTPQPRLSGRIETDREALNNAIAATRNETADQSRNVNLGGVNLTVQSVVDERVEETLPRVIRRVVRGADQLLPRTGRN